MYKIAEKFKREKIDGLFLPHCNFGTEFECARLAKELGVPVLLWGPLDERPDEKRCPFKRYPVWTFCNRKSTSEDSRYRLLT